MRVEFQLGESARARLFARVVARSLTDQRRLTLRLKLPSMPLEVTRAASSTGRPIPAQISESFRVLTGDSSVSVRLNGVLDDVAGEALAETLIAEVQRLRPASLSLFLDASRVSPSPEAGLAHLRRSLKHIADTGSFLGVLVGNHPLAMIQLERLSREAGVADSLVTFDNIQTALPIWAAVRDALSAGRSGSQLIPWPC